MLSGVWEKQNKTRRAARSSCSHSLTQSHNRSLPLSLVRHRKEIIRRHTQCCTLREKRRVFFLYIERSVRGRTSGVCLLGDKHHNNQTEKRKKVKGTGWGRKHTSDELSRIECKPQLSERARGREDIDNEDSTRESKGGQQKTKQSTKEKKKGAGTKGEGWYCVFVYVCTPVYVCMCAWM